MKIFFCFSLETVVLSFIYRSMIHPGLIFVSVVGSRFIFFLYGCVIVLVPSFEKTIMSSTELSWCFCYKSGDYRCVGVSLGFLSISIDLYFWFCASTILFRSLSLCSIVWGHGTWFFQLHFSFPTLLWLFGVFCVSIQIVQFFCFNSVKSVIDNLIGIALSLQIALWNIFIFTILILPIKEHGISLHLCYFWFLSSVSYSFLSTDLLPL